MNIVKMHYLKAKRYLCFGLALCLSLVLLTKPSHTQIQDTPASYKPPQFTCENASFFWDGHHYDIGKKIGSGSFGIVYDLLREGEDPGDLVLKIMFAKDTETLYRDALNEVKLANELPEVFVPTYYKSTYTVGEKDNKNLYGAFLIKNKISGFTLWNLITHPQRLKFLPSPYQSFLNFRETLTQKLIQLSQKDIYVWDLHANNIMYDVLRNDWILVDAERDVTFPKFIATIEDRLVYAHSLHPIHKIHQLLTKSRRLTREEIVRSIVAIYFESVEKQLEAAVAKAS